mmetsp:Transcript_32894/g.92119  ORF Transcript_32894/g.92119 Transcript_32894/m.92119 type:complete len:210 (+) Transcript_32894:76-705(+)
MNQVGLLMAALVAVAVAHPCDSGPSEVRGSFQLANMAKGCATYFEQGRYYYSSIVNKTKATFHAIDTETGDRYFHTVLQDYNTNTMYHIDHTTELCEISYQLSPPTIPSASPASDSIDYGATTFASSVVHTWGQKVPFAGQTLTVVRTVDANCMTVSAQVHNERGAPVWWELLYDTVPNLQGFRNVFDVPEVCRDAEKMEETFDFFFTI